MQRSSRSLLVIGLLAGAFSWPAVAREPKRLPATSHIFYDQVMTFKKGSAEISKADKETLAALLKTVKDRSQKIEQIHIAVWPDQARPAKTSLPEKDRVLTESRIVALEDYLETDLGLGYVESYNMAERSNWFSRALGANSRDVKTLFSQPGAPSNVTPEDFQIVKSKGAPSRAVMLIELEPSTTAASD